MESAPEQIAEHEVAIVSVDGASFILSETGVELMYGTGTESSDVSSQGYETEEAHTPLLTAAANASSKKPTGRFNSYE